MRTIKSTIIGISIAAASLAAWGQIKIGQSIGITGAVAESVKETNLGAKIYLDTVNAKGGVNGEKIELITLDDKFDPKLAAANAKELIEKHEVVALFMTRGTPHTQAILPLLDEYDIALLAPSTGAMVFHKPVQKHVFNVRATYQREAERAIAHLASTGVTQIGVVHVDDSFGADALEGVERGLVAAKLTAVAISKFDRSKPDFSQIAPSMAKLTPQAIVMIGAGSAVADGIKALKKAGTGGAQFVTLSNNASGGFIKLLGDDSRGVIVSQVLPQSPNYALVQEAALVAKAQGILEVSPAMLEGFTSAKVLVEALRRTGPKPTRAKLHATLNNFAKFELGGLSVSFTPTDHSGLDFSDLSIITASGRFRR
jgi:branched-chain amino acid transport system substrate-binding protein